MDVSEEIDNEEKLQPKSITKETQPAELGGLFKQEVEKLKPLN